MLLLFVLRCVQMPHGLLILLGYTCLSLCGLIGISSLPSYCMFRAVLFPLSLATPLRLPPRLLSCRCSTTSVCCLPLRPCKYITLISLSTPFGSSSVCCLHRRPFASASASLLPSLFPVSPMRLFNLRLLPSTHSPRWCIRHAIHCCSWFLISLFLSYSRYCLSFSRCSFSQRVPIVQTSVRWH